MNSFPNIRATAEKHLAANPDEGLYLLIDHAGMPGLHRKLKDSFVDWVSLFDRTRESGALSAAPILILIGGNSTLQISKSSLHWISERAAEASSVIMLASRLAINELSAELTLRLHVKISENMGALLRYFDARTFSQLMDILAPEQIAILCGPARKWWYVDRFGEIAKVEREFKHIKSDFRPLDLSEEQEFALISASEPDQVLHVLMTAMPQLKSIMPKNQYSFIADNNRSASRLGLSSLSDLVLYSAMVTLHGANFETLPYWESALDDVRSKRICFADAVAGSEDVAWEVE